MANMVRYQDIKSRQKIIEELYGLKPKADLSDLNTIFNWNDLTKVNRLDIAHEKIKRRDELVGNGNLRKEDGTVVEGDAYKVISNCLQVVGFKRLSCKLCLQDGHSTSHCSRMWCLTCKKWGHLTQDCLFKGCNWCGGDHPSSRCTVTSDSRRSNLKCLKCGRIGHTALFCTSNEWRCWSIWEFLNPYYRSRSNYRGRSYQKRRNQPRNRRNYRGSWSQSRRNPRRW